MKNYIKKTWDEVDRKLENLKRRKKTKTIGRRSGRINQQKAIKGLWDIV